jgi:hypothetical protein
MADWQRLFVSFRGRCIETNVVSEPYASNGCFSGYTVLALSKYAIISNGTSSTDSEMYRNVIIN